MNFYLTYESRGCLKSFTLFITVKTPTKLNLESSVKVSHCRFHRGVLKLLTILNREKTCDQAEEGLFRFSCPFMVILGNHHFYFLFFCCCLTGVRRCWVVTIATDQKTKITIHHLWRHPVRRSYNCISEKQMQLQKIVSTPRSTFKKEGHLPF